MKILVTGCAGFIGYNLCLRLIGNKKFHIYGLDCLDSYYDVRIKKNRIKQLKNLSKKFEFKKINLVNQNMIIKDFANNKYDYIVHLAAQAGVKYSTINPKTYLNNNVIGFFNILEAAKKINIKHLIFASTSSVYGDSKKFPLRENFNTDKPLSFYAATKKSNEIMAYSYSHIYKIPCTGLRIFTVYGPNARPDMALFKFTKSILSSKKINLYNYGNHIRDFTYIDDVVESIYRIIKKPPKNKTPFTIFNVGSNRPVNLKYFLKIIEQLLSKKAKTSLKGLQIGDVWKTHANIDYLSTKISYNPKISLLKGIEKFISWYKNYYGNDR